MRIRNAIAREEIVRYFENENCYIPKQLLPNRFAHFAADNIDILEETLDKAPTFHGTQIVAFQAGPPNRDLKDTLDILPYKVALQIPEKMYSLHKIEETSSANI